MREITRIHLAKIAYDIELDAKKEIEKYIAALERYAGDVGIMEDIEIRITELLAEQGVQAGGVIASSDVAAVRAQLGEPSDFAAEGADEVMVEESESRRVYRSEDDAILGGVLSGFGRFFGIDPLWVRLLFVLLLLASFGTALVAYLVLWLIIPPAQTAADKLRMSGQSVTLASIKELASTDEQRGEVARITRRVLSVATGSLLVLTAIAGLIAIIAAVFGVQFDGWIYEGDRWIREAWWFMPMMGLFVASGLLFSALCFVLASAVFRRQWSRRIGVAVVAIITAGLVVFASGVGVGMYGYASEQARMEALRESVTTTLPASFMNVKKVTFVDLSDVYGTVYYIVSDTPRYTLDTHPGVKADVRMSEDGQSAVIGLTGEMSWNLGADLRIYGPALDAFTTESDNLTTSYYNDKPQAKFMIDARDAGAGFSLDAGEYGQVSVQGDAYSRIALGVAVISDLSVEGGGVEAGVVRRLTVIQPDICPAHDGFMGRNTTVRVYGVSGGIVVYNGKEEPARTITNTCSQLIIGDEDDGEEW